MIFIDKMKNLKIYKTNTFLPTVENDKKKKSVVLLMTPNYESSKKLMNSKLFVNKLRFASYYLHADVSYYINSNKASLIEDDSDTVREYYEYENMDSILEMSSKDRNNLPDSKFGIPSKRKYPLDSEDRVRSAIKFFNYCDKNDEKQLADNIIKAMKEYDITDVNISTKNRFFKYYHATNESCKVYYPENNKYPIEDVYGVYDKDGLYNACVKVKGINKPLRGRSEVLIIKDGKVYLSFKKNGSYRIPGGSWDENEDHLHAAKRETQEEAKMDIKNITYCGTYIELYDQPRKWVEENIDKKDQWYGYFTEVYVANYDKKYTGNVDKIDQDNNMIKHGKFCNVEEVWDILKESHKEALTKFAINKPELKFRVESYKDDILNYLSESYSVNTGDKVIFFNEDNNSAQLRKLLYNDRIRKRQEVLNLYDKVKADNPFIKYTFADIEKYQKKNLFVDLYYYNNLFFQNNVWTLNKGLSLYFDFMNKLVNNPAIKNAGYEKQTIFIPVLDWDKINPSGEKGSIWNYRKTINPMSIMYHMMINGNENKLINIFGNRDILFISNNYYFKINFSEIDKKDIIKLANQFKLFLIKMTRNENFDPEDIDTTADNVESKEVISAKLVDKIELAKGVDLTSTIQAVRQSKKSANTKEPTAFIGYNCVPAKKVKEEIKTSLIDSKDKASKTVVNKSNSNKADLDKLANYIDDVSSTSNSEEEAIDKLDNEYAKSLILGLDNIDANNGVDITSGRAARITELDKALLDKEIKGKSIKDILKEPVKEIKTTSLDVSSPNEEWKNLSFANFDKDYDINKDIVACFRHFADTSRPISIRNIEVTDNSTSEDRVELYKVEMEDYRGKRFTIKLDIPIMKDNRFLLRGNGKSIQTQFFNMPIIKTDFFVCQIISNYMKIFVRKFGSGVGKSMPVVSRFIKALNKYKGNNIKITFGDNSKVCTKYELPMDYIDIATVISKIEYGDYIIFFNQDEIRELYNYDKSLGFPYAYDKKNKQIIHSGKELDFVSSILYKLMDDKAFAEVFNTVKPANICAYSRCSIMNTNIPLIVICAYHEGLRKTLDKALVEYQIVNSITKDIRENAFRDWIKFNDGYLVYTTNYSSSLLLNGLKACPTELFSIADIDNQNMYLEFLDDFGGRIKADGLDNFYDLMVDPMTKETLEFYKMPTDYVSILLYANSLLADNKFINHTDTSSRRIRRYELIAVYTYKVLADAFASYANQLKHSRDSAEFFIKQSAVIDKFLTDSITSDDSCINALRDIETTNSVTTKGPTGMNSDRAYSLDKRGFDPSMVNVLGMSTGFASNVGITRQATINSNVESERGYVKNIKGDINKMNTANTLTATEALTPFGSTHDDPMRTAMTFIQTAKHMVRTEESDPLLVTNGYDEALAYLSSDRFAFKSKKDGKVLELTDQYILIEYNDGSKDFINLNETIEKNSDGGYYVPLKLDVVDKLKVGSKVKEGQILAYDKYSFSNSLGESDNIAYNVGKLAKVAIINTDEGFEDSGVITEKMAEKLATRINLEYNAIIDKDSNVFDIVKVGDSVEAGDNLIVWQSPFDDEDANSLLKTLASSEEEVSELGKRTIKSGVTGVVKGIKMYRTIELEEMSDSLRKIVDNYEKPLRALKKKLEENNLDTSQVPAHYTLPPVGKLKKSQEAVRIEIYVEYIDTVGVGDKVVYFSANKAIEKRVIPKGKEPYTDFRPNENIDAFVSEVSIDKRLVTSTLITGSLQKLMIELDRSVKDIMGIPYNDTEV